MMRVYFDNASTTPIHKDVIASMCEVMENDFGNPSSIHFYGRKAKSIIENARKSIAKVLNASIGEIFFTGTASEANNMILKNVVESLGVTRIITSPTEHPCILESLAYLQKHKNIHVDFLSVNNLGQIDVSALDQILSTNPEKKLVTVMHGNNEIGTMINLDEVSTICAKHQTLFHCDTVQTLGKYPIDLSKTNVSFISGSAHKFHGPKGVGFMYINNENIIPPYIHGGAQERNMRAGTENVAGIAGMAKALDISTSNMSENLEIISALREKLKDGLKNKFKDIVFNGAQEGLYLKHVLNVSFPPGPKADLLVHNLDIGGVACSSASACSSGIETDSHVLKAIQHDPNRKAIRFSFSPLNTEEELDYVLKTLEQFSPLL